MFGKLRQLILLLLVGLVMISAYPAPQEDYDDLNSAASDHEHLGRVQIKVYRGPDEHDGHDHFAPWGFWVKQPADDDHHH